MESEIEYVACPEGFELKCDSCKAISQPIMYRVPCKGMTWSHIRADCSMCKRYIKFVPQNNRNEKHKREPSWYKP